MPESDTRLRAKDVQRLLWAAGEARRRRRELTRPTRRRRSVEARPPATEGDFFTEWQPAGSLTSGRVIASSTAGSP